MFPSSNDYDETISRVIRPRSEVVIREYSAEEIPIEDITYYSNIDTDLMKGSPNFEPLRDNTYYATFALGGYRVGDENLRCVPDEEIINNDVMPISKYTLWDGSVNFVYKLKNITKLNQDIYITIAPTYLFKVGIHLTGYDSNDHIVTDKVQIVDRSTEVKTLHFVLDQVCEYWAVSWGAFNNIDTRVSIYPPSTSESGEHTILFNNSNLTNLTYEKNTDLYVQNEFNYTLTVTALDLDRLFDPANPKGIYDKFTELYRVLVSFGTDVGEGKREYPYRKVMYLAEKPEYDGYKITCKFSLLPWIVDAKNNNLIAPLWGIKPNAKREYNNVFERMGSVYAISPNYSRVFVPRIMIEKAGYIREDYKSDGYTSATTNKDIYKLLTNATGRYISEGIYTSKGYNLYGYTTQDFNEQLRMYFSGELLPVKHISNNDILNFSLEIMPQLKTLTVVRYTNEDTDNIIREFKSVGIPVSQFEDYKDTLKRAYFDFENNNDQVSSCKVYNMKNANLYWYTAMVKTDNNTGIPRTSIMIEVEKSSLGTNDVRFDLDLYGVKQTRVNVDLVVNETGEDMIVDNPYITTDKLVEIAQKTIKAIAKCREVYTLDVRQDFRLQVGDIITIDTPYENEIPCIITGLKFNMPSVKGQLICRRLHNELD